MIEPLVPSDLIHICMNLKTEDLKEYLETSESTNPPLELATNSMPNENNEAYCVKKDGVPIVAFGIKQHHSQMGYVWLLSTDQISDVAMELARGAKKILLNRSLKTKRIYTFSAEYRKDAHRWLEFLGLSNESTMPCFGKSGASFYIYSMLRA